MKNSQINQPLVSVIIPNYNHARYLDQRIQSVLNQTYRNIEVIILDDCSSDNSIEVINKYRDDDCIAHVIINEKNSGNTFLQWDKGLHLATGELVWIAESDDYCKTNMLEKLVSAFLRMRGPVLSYSTSTYVDDEGQVLSSPGIFANCYISGKAFLKRYLALTNVIANASSCVFLREAALSVPSNYQTYKGAGDYLFWVELASRGRVAIVNEGLNCFRRHTGVVTERRYADGTNFSEEKLVMERLGCLVHLSLVRKKLAYAYRARRISKMKFINDTIVLQMNSLWDTKKSQNLPGRILLKISDRLRNKYNYYL